MKISYLQLLTVLSLPFLILSCSEQKINVANEIDTIQISNVSGEEYALSENVKKRELLPVTWDDSDIFPVQVERILSTGEHIVLLDRQVADAAFIYNPETARLELIGEKGRGPGEYTGVDDIYFDPESNRIILLDGSQGKLISYSAEDFSFADERQIGFSATRFSAGPDHFYFKAGANPEKMVNVTDRNLEVTGRFIDNDIRHHFNPVHSLYSSGSKVFYYSRYMNLLFSFENGEKENVRKILFEDDNFTEQDFASAPDIGGDYEAFTEYADQYRSNFFAIEETPGLVYIFYSFQG